VSRRIKELRKTAAAAAASAGEETPTAERKTRKKERKKDRDQGNGEPLHSLVKKERKITLCLSYASPELLAQLRAEYLPTEEPTPEAALGTSRFPFKSSSKIDTEMEEAIRLGDARNAARLGRELERAKSREFQAARESAAQAELWR
jgi:hypothetical protein